MIHDKSLSPFIVESIQNYGVYCVRAMRPIFFYMINENFILNSMSSKAHWQVNKTIAMKIGIEPALLISDLMQKYKYFANKNQLIEKYNQKWFFNTSDDIKNSTTLSYKQQKRCLDILQANNFIKFEKFGFHGKLHFTILWQNIYEMMSIDDSQYFHKVKSTIDLLEEEQFPKGEKNNLQKAKRQYNNNKDNNNKINKNKESEKVIVENKNIIEEREREIVSARAHEKTQIVLTDYRAVVEQPDNFVYSDPDQLKTTILNWCTENIETVMMWYSEVKTVYVHENARELIRTFIAYYSEDKAFNRDPVRFFRSKYIKWLIREKNGFTKK